MSRGPWRRLTWEPFERAFESTHGHASIRRVASICGVSERTVFAARRRGLTFAVADRMATRIGHHMASIWPDAYERRSS